MTTLSLFSPRSFFVKLTDIFQKREVAPITMSPSYNLQEEAHEYAQPEPMKSKLNINLDDLKVISTALLHYRRNLSKQGDIERAEGVGRIDKQFYELIQSLEIRSAA